MRSVEIELDDRWLLPIPRDVDMHTWAQECVASLRSEPGREAQENVDALAGVAASADPNAIANLIYCPDGLPGRALVAVYAEASTLETLDDLPELAPAALPRQVMALRDHSLAVGRVISTVTQVPEVGLVGTFQYQLLGDGVLREVVVTSPSLPHLGAGMTVFEELIERIVITPERKSAYVPA